MQHASQHPLASGIKMEKYTGRICRAPKLTVQVGLLTPIKTGTQALFVLRRLREQEPATNTQTSLSTVCIATLFCTFTVSNLKRASQVLDPSLSFFISPETPDSVSIRPVDNLSSVVVEEREVQLQCDITNVAPARNLTVRWYRGNETFAIKGLEISSLRKFLPFL